MYTFPVFLYTWDSICIGSNQAPFNYTFSQEKYAGLLTKGFRVTEEFPFQARQMKSSVGLLFFGVTLLPINGAAILAAIIGDGSTPVAPQTERGDKINFHGSERRRCASPCISDTIPI